MIVSISIAGCVSLPQNELPTRGPAAIKLTGDRPSIDYELSLSVMGEQNAGGLENLDQRVSMIFNRSEAFSSVRLGIGGEPHHVRISLDASENLVLVVLSGIVSIMSFGVFPWYARDEYVLTAQIERGAQLVKRYEYHESVVTLGQFFLVFFMAGRDPEAVGTSVIDNMLWNLVVDMQRDGVFLNPAQTSNPMPGGCTKIELPFFYPR